MKYLQNYFVIAFFLASCQNNNSSTLSHSNLTFTEDTAIYLRVYEGGSQIMLNGNPTSLSNLESRFKELNVKGGLVFYSYAGATEDPPKQGPVIDLIKKYKLGIVMYTDSTFHKSFQ